MDRAKKSKVDELQPGPSSSNQPPSSSEEENLPLAARRKDAKGKVKKSSNFVNKASDDKSPTKEKDPKGTEIKTSTKRKVPKGKVSEEAVSSGNPDAGVVNDSDDEDDSEATSQEAGQGWSISKRRRAMKVSYQSYNTFWNRVCNNVL